MKKIKIKNFVFLSLYFNQKYMSLFQKSVTNKYIKNLDTEKVDKAFEKFQKFYGDKLRLVNIMQLKEENYQEGFLREIFVETLGYTINPDKDYNLTTEYKNQKDARKADGAIIDSRGHAPLAIGVIELKSTKTKNLESIREQAFSYKVNQPGCKYVITSNFQSLRFYVDNATEYEEFNLFRLDKKQFKLLYLLLSKESIFNDLPEKLKNETKFHENNISDRLYKDYKHFKDGIFESIVKNNPQYDKLTLFKKSQKLLDRFLFVFFAEDCGLIPPNTISKVVSDWKNLKKLNYYQPLYKLFKDYFSYLDKGKNIEDWGQIPAYNGGLFRSDEILDNPEFKIDDIALEKDSLTLSAYDFNTEVDVNILGHIFEHSLNEIEEITAELSAIAETKGHAPLSSHVPVISKRKKDGVFYTPKYITKYIVENTVGTLCNEKKEELQINNLLIDENYRRTATTRRHASLSEKGKKLFKTLNDYKDWLLTLKILDPACGSGAFLNQTLDFLIAEHKQADDLLLELTGDKLGLFDTDKSILENNIYGVDINEESVEIAKLSLWLRTAQKGRPLSDLSNSIKCGNSLIDDPEVAGDKAFDWNLEFKEIMDNGGFDVVVGNPPWGSKITPTDNNFIAAKYKISTKNLNLFLPFIYLSYNIVKQKGISHLLIPKVFIKNASYTNTRSFLLKNTSIIHLVDYGIFPKVASETISVSYSKQIKLDKTKIVSYQDLNNYKAHEIKTQIFYQNPILAFSFQINNEKAILLKKIRNKSIHLSEVVKIKRGIETGQNSDLIKCDNCGAYNVISSKYYSKKTSVCKVCNKKINTETTISVSKRKIDNFYTVRCLSGREVNRYSVNNYYYIPKQLKAINYKNNINVEKIFIKRISTNIQAVFFPENNNTLSFNTLYNLYDFKLNPLFILSIINSKLLYFYYELDYNLGMNLTTQITIEYLKTVPVKDISKVNQQPFIKKADLMLSLNKELQTKSEKFIKRIKANLEVAKLTNKLKNFYNFDFKIFVSELKKQKIKLSFKQQDEWEDYFDSYKQEINNLQHQINQTDNQIDKMVYELYELTEEEIEIVEKSVK